jgi:hypothetical protein
MQDVDLSSSEYGDPFSPELIRFFSVCQQAAVEIPVLEWVSQRVIVSNSAIVSALDSVVSPLIGPVQTPTINDHDLFTAGDIKGGSFQLEWTKPSLGTPSGYVIKVFSFADRSDFAYFNVASLRTAKERLTLPPDMLQPGNTYLFLITAIVDGRANIESAPNRLGFPAGNADVISAPITIRP